MSVAEPARPIVRPADALPVPPVRHAPDWLPEMGWFVEGGGRHTRIYVDPIGITQDRKERITVTIKFFRGGAQPDYRYVSPPFAGSETFCYSGDDLLEAIGDSSFEGQVEVTVRRLDRSPSEFLFADCWFEFSSDDGTLNGSMPGFLFKGGITKRMMSAKWQHWPGVAANDQYRTSVLLLNYHAKPVEVRFDLFAPSGASRSSAPFEIAPHKPSLTRIEDAIPGARELLSQEGGFGAVRVYSPYKLPGFVMMEQRATGVVTCFDHTSPFGGPLVD